MINLLPIDNRKQIKASFHNLFLLRLITLFILSIIIIAGIFVLMNSFLDNEKNSLDKQLTANQKKSSSLSDVKIKSKNILNGLNYSKSIFAEQRHYSDFLLELANSLPNNVYIRSLVVAEDLTRKPSSFIIDTDDYDEIIATKRRLEKSPLIEGVSIEVIMNNNPGAKKETRLSITFNKDAVDKALKWQK